MYVEVYLEEGGPNDDEQEKRQNNGSNSELLLLLRGCVSPNPPTHTYTQTHTYTHTHISKLVPLSLAPSLFMNFSPPVSTSKIRPRCSRYLVQSPLAAAAAGAISERCRPRTHKVTGVASMPYNRKARRGRGANAAGCSKMPEGVVLVGGKGGTKDAAYAFARYIPTHTPAHIHTHCLSPSLAHTHTHTHMHAHKRALSHSHTQSHTH